MRAGTRTFCHIFLLNLLVASVICGLAIPTVQADEVRLAELSCTALEMYADADISGDLVVWGEYGWDWWGKGISSRAFDLLTGNLTGGNVQDASAGAVIKARISGDRLATWGYHVADLQAASLQVYDYTSLSTLVDLPVLAGSADIDGDMLVYAGWWDLEVECQDAGIDRAGMAYLIASGLAGGEGNVPPGPATPTFPDVPADFWAYDYIEHIVAEGIAHGYGDGYFYPTGQVTRDQMAVYLCRAVSGPSDPLAGYTPPGTPTFEDVSASHWAYTDIEYLNTVVSDATCSASPMLFCPDALVQAGTAASWVEQALGTAVDACGALARPQDRSIYALDIGTAEQWELTGADAQPAFPTLSGDWVVWQDARNDNWDIYLLNLSVTPTEAATTRLTDDPGDQTKPSISGNRVVWQDNRTGDWDIYVYEIPATPATTSGTLLTNDPADQMLPSISGDLVVYQDNRNGNWDIYLYDLATNAEFQITDDPADQTHPRIDGRRIVYCDNRDGCAVYAFDLDAVPPVVDFAADVTEGDRPLAVQFTDLSVNEPLWRWEWSFGDGLGSAERDPSHTYELPHGGSYDVSLTVTGLGGAATATYPNLIDVSEPGWATAVIRHGEPSQLLVEIGCGDPASPSWVETLWDGVANTVSLYGWDGDLFWLGADLQTAAALLPPAASNPWWLRIADTVSFYEGEILAFSVDRFGVEYGCTDVPIPVPDGYDSALAFISGWTPEWVSTRLMYGAVGGAGYPPTEPPVGPVVGPFNLSNYFPLGDRDYWAYESSATWGYAQEYVCSWGASEFGGTATVALHSCEWDAEPWYDWHEQVDYYAVSPSGLAHHGYQDLDTGDVWTYDPPLLLPNGLALGDSGSQALAVYRNGSYLGDATISYQLTGTEDVSLPSGLFQNCLKISLTINAVALGEGIISRTEWYAYGVGIVKRDETHFTAAGPDLVIRDVDAPVGVSAGVPFDVAVTTANFGTDAAPATRTAIYLSVDPEITVGDTLLATVDVPSLGPGGQHVSTLSVAIPSVGAYYIGAYADVEDAVDETMEDNNARAAGQPVTVVPELRADLVALTVSGPEVMLAGSADPVTVSFQTANQGNRNAAGHKAAVYMSEDARITTDDILLGTTSCPGLAAGSTYSGSLSVTVPVNLPPGSYYWGLIADPPDKVLELSEANNTAASRVALALPDLLVSELAAPASWPLDSPDPMVVSFTVANLGGWQAPATSLNIYWSPDSEITAQDSLLAAVACPALGPEESYSDSTDVAVPTGQDVGTYYLGALVDPVDEISELDEINNVAAQAVALTLPDLVMQSVLGPGSAKAGSTDPVQVLFSVANIGGCEAAASTVGVYFSVDQQITTGDTILGGVPCPTLAPYQSHSSTVSVTLPAGIVPGTYYVGAIADPSDEIQELNNDNNTAFDWISLSLPDLAISYLTGPDSVPSGATEPVDVSFQVSNWGEWQSPAAMINIYWSLDSEITTADVLLSSASCPALDPWASHAGTVQVNIPAEAAPGSYYLGAIVDPAEEVAELNESNNTGIHWISVTLPDLTLWYLDGPGSVPAGTTEPVEISFRVHNSGGWETPESTVNVYWSVDSEITTEDTSLGSANCPQLDPWASHDGTVQVTIPADAGPGNYYLGAIVDPAEEIAELDEENNTRADWITLTAPDLTAYWTSAPWQMSAATSDPVDVSVRVYNYGAAAAPATSVDMYLSTDSDISAGDAFLGSAACPALEPYDHHTSTLSVSLPDGTPAGYYYLGALVDPNDEVEESNETNNVALRSISLAYPDLTMTQLSATRWVDQGSSAPVEVSLQVHNCSYPAAPAAGVGVYLSPDSQITTDDTLLGTTDCPALAAYERHDATLSVMLPQGVDPGSYYVGAIVDPADSIPERSETNNTSSTSIRVMVASGTPLVLDWSDPLPVIPEPGTAYAFPLQVPSGAPNLFVTLRKVASGWYGELRLFRDGELIASDSGYQDHILHVANPPAGDYSVTISGVGQGRLAASTALPELPLGEWVVGTIPRNDGYAWYQVTVPADTSSLFIRLETLGCNCLTVYPTSPTGAVVGRSNTTLEVQSPESGVYYVRVWDHAYLQGGSQVRDHMIKADVVPVDPPPCTEPLITEISPTTGGTAGPVTVTINGQCLDPEAVVYLIRDGHEAVYAHTVVGSEDQRTLSATFHLSGAELGDWTLVVVNPDAAGAIAPVPFVVESGGDARLWVDITGRETLRAGKWADLILRFGNEGTVDSGPALLMVQGEPGWTVRTDLPAAAEGESVSGDWIDLQDSSLGLWIPNLPAGRTDEVSLGVYCPLLTEGTIAAGLVRVPATAETTTAWSVPVSAFAGKSQVLAASQWDWGPPGSEPPRGAIVVRKSKGGGTGHVGIYLGNGRIKDLVNSSSDEAVVREVDLSTWHEGAGGEGEFLAWGTPSGWTPALGEQIADWAEGIADGAIGDYLVTPFFDTWNCVKFVKWVYGTLGIALPWDELTSPGMIYEEMSGRQWPDWRGISWLLIPRHLALLYLGPPGYAMLIMEFVASGDPEDKFGPSGFDQPATALPQLQRWVPADRPVPYRIEVWNREDATASAQDVVIVDQLDSNLDWSTFSFTEVGFLDWRVEVGPCQYFNVEIPDVTIDFSAYYADGPTVDMNLNVEGVFDAETGLITWEFHAFDPETGIPPEYPRAGFLPPITDSGWEMSWVEFTVRPMQDLPSGTQISNQAFVKMDVANYEPAPQEGPYFNTLDTVAPVSWLHPLTEVQWEPEFEVSWAGEDDPDGCGVCSYMIYASADGGPPEPWLTSTPDTSAIFSGAPGVTYDFYSRAKDCVGNLEPMPTDPGAWTTVEGAMLFEFRPPLVAEQLVVCKPNSTVPVKFTLTDMQGYVIPDATVRLSLWHASDYILDYWPDLAQAEWTYANAVFWWDDKREQYILELKTRGMAPGTWALRVTIDEWPWFEEVALVGLR